MGTIFLDQYKKLTIADEIKIKFVLYRKAFDNYLPIPRKRLIEDCRQALRNGRTHVEVLKVVERKFHQEMWLLRSERTMRRFSIIKFGYDINAGLTSK